MPTRRTGQLVLVGLTAGLFSGLFGVGGGVVVVPALILWLGYAEREATGTSLVATNIPVQPKDTDGLVRIAHELRIDFYLASMDDPQPLGLVDRLLAEGIPCYGPTRAAAQLESSKAWAKAFMDRQRINTAPWRRFDDHAAARAYLESRGDRPVVVKASGLAAGKGAIVCDGLSDALAALDAAMVQREFGAAGDTVVIEDRLSGPEASAHAICDGKTAKLMQFATDYKRALDGDRGLNTGGMGAYSPSRAVDADLAARVQGDVVDRVMGGMAAEGHPFCGTLFPGLMLTGEGTFVIEFNARFGDPETQVLLPRLRSDLYQVCRAAAAGQLAPIELEWSPGAAVGVVLASGGYPEAYRTGFPISGLDAVDPDVLVFHAGTREQDGAVLTAGGRVLTVVGLGGTIAEARARAYDNIRRISFTGSYYRTDIAREAVE